MNCANTKTPGTFNYTNILIIKNHILLCKNYSMYQYVVFTLINYLLFVATDCNNKRMCDIEIIAHYFINQYIIIRNRKYEIFVFIFIDCYNYKIIFSTYD